MCHGSKSGKTIRFKTEKPRQPKPYKREQKNNRDWEEDSDN
jgi:hypothetical protein